MERDSGVAAQELRVDGGAAMNDWLMGFQAEVLGVPVRRPALVETTALGAAGLAGLATGVWTDGSEFMSALGESTTFFPSISEEERRSLLSGWRRALAAARAWSKWDGGDGPPGGSR
jgi:glycerol kinase